MEIHQDKEIFFDIQNDQALGLTFDDVRLRTKADPDFDPEKIDLSTKFSENISLEIPLVSAAMSSVTESKMAIKMAELGGLGVIHAGLSIENQKKELRKVKKHMNSLIEKPICVLGSWTINQLLNYCTEKEFDFRTFPVVNVGNKYVGIISANDYKYIDDLDTPIDQIMVPKKDSIFATKEMELKDVYNLLKSKKTSTLPVVDKNNEVTGLYIWSDLKRIYNHKGKYNVDKKGQLLVGAAISTANDVLDRVSEIKNYTDVLVIDSADGGSKFVFDTLKKLKENYASIDVVVGNISEPEAALKLAEWGANGIKVGQGPGSVCTTRIETGIGMPQVSALYNCFRALHNKNYKDLPICADGGIKERGDISIALAVGGWSVMLGRMLAGTDASPGKILYGKNQNLYKEYYGMGSEVAFRNFSGNQNRYKINNHEKVLAEGVEAKVPYQGKIEDNIANMVAALKKSLFYVKAHSIKEHRLNTLLTRITNSGYIESLPHDVNDINYGNV